MFQRYGSELPEVLQNFWKNLYDSHICSDSQNEIMEHHEISELMKVQKRNFLERNKFNFSAGKTFKILGYYFHTASFGHKVKEKQKASCPALNVFTTE